MARVMYTPALYYLSQSINIYIYVYVYLYLYTYMASYSKGISVPQTLNTEVHI